MIENHVCAVCGWPWLKEPQRYDTGGTSEEICDCCGFQSGYSDQALCIPVEEWRRRWVEGGMRFKWSDDTLPPPGWDPVAQLATLSGESEPSRDLPDNHGLRAALSAGDVMGAARALVAGTVVLASTGPADDDLSILAEVPGGVGLLVFTGPESWGAWAREQEWRRWAQVIDGVSLLDAAQAQGVGCVVIDPVGPATVSMTLDQLRSLTTPGAAPS